MIQYQSLFGYSGVEIRFTNSALDEICRKAAERGGGARGLRGIMVGLNHRCSFVQNLAC
jgi:ATP-dependent Clp protease ATP-binding subunit ClpX